MVTAKAVTAIRIFAANAVMDVTLAAGATDGKAAYWRFGGPGFWCPGRRANNLERLRAAA
jgi:hypothetical protein